MAAESGTMPHSTMEYFVSPAGRDSNPGTRDAPFATLDRARAAARKFKSRKPDAPVAVTLRQGLYRLAGSFELTSADSGTAGAPVTYRAAPGERPILTGGRRISGFTPVKDPAILGRLDRSVRGKVFQSDLKEAGITDYGDYEETDWINSSGSRLELFFNDRPMQIARWPNKGFARSAGVVDPVVIEEKIRGNRSGMIVYGGTRPNRWKNEKHLRLHGYWFYDWAEQRMAVEKIDTAKKTIALKKPETHCYGFRKGQRFFAYNALCELDAPGEWFLDPETGILYFYPPGPLAGSSAVVSMTAAPLVKMTGVSHMVFRGITLEAGRSHGLVVSGGSDVRIAGCVFRNLGAWGVQISGGSKHGVAGCDIYETGEGGIALSGGDRASLKPSGHYAVNNHIHHFARWRRICKSGISMDGVGIRVANNLIHDAPHMAINFGGNDHLIELNEIYNVVYDAFDAGAVYCGRDPSMQGTMIRHNYFHHVGRIADYHGVASIYFDDGHCGNTVFGNIFYKAGVPGRCKFGAVFVHGGRYNNIENNVFVECGQAYNETPWDQKRWRKYWSTPPYNSRLFGKSLDVRKEPYASRYPWLANVLNDRRPNILARNIVHKCGAFKDRGTLDCVDNLLRGDPKFLDAARHNFQIRDDSPAYKRGFKRIPVARIGLIDDEDRASLPQRGRAPESG
ncbi:MAG: right-handed parallel beta-helix repeat-containing protein [Lentisphaerae bacterium]|nr:right-handed parallel beta-helix repeat-containing protein [Lentisphaerota bacterium]